MSLPSSPNRTLFIDRDGVINRRLPGRYVREWQEFEFLPGVLDALQQLNPLFNRIFLVTNQQGLAKGLLTDQELAVVHQHMLAAVTKAGGRIDQIYYCGELKTKAGNCRKPAPAMALQARADFPEIDFQQSIMVGDSISDMEFGKNLGMATILVTTKEEEAHLWASCAGLIDYRVEGLLAVLGLL